MNRSLLPPALHNPLAGLQPATRPSAGAGADETRSFEFSRALIEARQAARPPSLVPNAAAIAPPAAPEPPPRASERAPEADRAQRPPLRAQERTPERADERAEGRGNGPQPEVPDEAPRPRATEGAARRTQPPERTATRGAGGAAGPDDPASAKGAKGGKGAGAAGGATRTGNSLTRPGARKASAPDVDSAGAPDGLRGPSRAESRPSGDAATVIAGPELRAQGDPAAGQPTVGGAEASVPGAVASMSANAAGNLGNTITAAQADVATGARAAAGAGHIAGTAGHAVTAAAADLAAAASAAPGASDSGAVPATPDAAPSLAETSARQARGAMRAAPGASGEASMANAPGDAFASFKGAGGAGVDTGAKAATAATATTTLAAQGPLAGAFAIATPASAGAHTPTREATLASGPGQEGFARELGAQLSVFVREGVQQARLQLNPQDMGPVLVQIQLEGQTAQVHMAAELQPTRQALEQALPTLASQLSDAGITLTGGGVSERPDGGFGAEGRAGRDAGTPRGHDGGAGDPGFQRKGAEAAPETGRWSRERSLVDLIA